MAQISYLSTLMLPQQPSWGGTIQRYCINFSEWIFSFPLIQPSFEYTSDLKLREVEESTLQKTLHVMVSILFILSCKTHPAIFALALIPKIYHRDYLQAPQASPLPESLTEKAPLPSPTTTPTNFPPLNTRQKEQVKHFISLADFHMRHEQLNAALHVIKVAPYERYNQAINLGLKELEVYILLKDEKRATETAELLIKTINFSDDMEKILPMVVRQLLKEGYVECAHALITQNRFPDSTDKAKFALVGFYISKGNTGAAKAILDPLVNEQLHDLVNTLHTEELYAIALWVIEHYPNRFYNNLTQAAIYAHTGQLEKAESFLGQLTRTFDSPFNTIAYANVLRKIGKHGQAIRILENLSIELEKYEPCGVLRDIHRCSLAQIFFEEKKGESLALLIDSFESSFHREHRYLLLVKLYAEQNRPDLIEQIIKEEKVAYIECTSAKALLVQTYLNQDQVAQAKQVLTSIKYSSELPKLQLEFCSYFIKKRMFEQARNIIEEIKDRHYYLAAKLALAGGLMKERQTRDGIKYAGSILENILAYPVEA